MRQRWPAAHSAPVVHSWRLGGPIGAPPPPRPPAPAHVALQDDEIPAPPPGPPAPPAPPPLSERQQTSPPGQLAALEQRNATPWQAPAAVQVSVPPAPTQHASVAAAHVVVPQVTVRPGGGTDASTGGGAAPASEPRAAVDEPLPLEVVARVADDEPRPGELPLELPSDAPPPPEVSAPDEPPLEAPPVEGPLAITAPSGRR